MGTRCRRRGILGLVLVEVEVREVSRALMSSIYCCQQGKAEVQAGSGHPGAIVLQFDLSRSKRNN